MMTTVLDPVCGMTVDPARAAGQVEHQGQMYYFCSKGCAAKFTADPERFLARASIPVASVPSHQPPDGPARCTRRSYAIVQALVRSAGWRWSR